MMIDIQKTLTTSDVTFGTSGVRGLVSDITLEVCAAYAAVFIKTMRLKYEFDVIGLAIDNRPSSLLMLEYFTKAITSLGVKPIYFGVIPTPALALETIKMGVPAIMITGSHIPFDRNGFKFYTPDGEITKLDEEKIKNTSFVFELSDSVINLDINPSAKENYIERYTSLCRDDLFKNKRVGIYEHSSAGRDLYREIFERLGAEVISLDRSDTFVPIDTEAVSEEDRVKAISWIKEYDLDFLFSTDGDGDRPLVADEHGHWLRGDILGLLCSKILGIDAVAIPVSCNTSVYKCGYFKEVTLTKIGSPFVIEACETLIQKYGKVSGFEANGGYLLATDVEVNKKRLVKLLTRDAILPVILLFSRSIDENIKISKLVAALPARFTSSDRIQDFAKEKSIHLINEVQETPHLFLEKIGLNTLSCKTVDNTDGLRITLNDESIIHLRPSGNAPELRFYVEADSPDLADNRLKILLNKSTL